jgi:hypothetical protein
MGSGGTTQTRSTSAPDRTATPEQRTSNHPGHRRRLQIPGGSSAIPKSRIGAIRLIGYSPTAGFVLTVIMDAVDQAGITAWKTRGSDLRDYLEGKDEI